MMGLAVAMSGMSEESLLVCFHLESTVRTCMPQIDALQESPSTGNSYGVQRCGDLIRLCWWFL